MLIAIVDGGSIQRLGNYRTMFPNVSFPASGPDSGWMTQNNAKFVLATKSFDATTQRIESVEPYVEGDYVYSVRVVELTSQETTNRANAINEQVATSKRSERNRLLTNTDWTQVTDSPLSSDKKTEWANYRTALRDLPTKSGWPNVDMPNTSVYIT
tara:strand:- start:424 stop:891 length:468 start_codon:yes stop_codon:yes gene_type:complete